MRMYWSLFTRWGLPLAKRTAKAMPLMLGVAALLVMIAIWWLGPHWTWRDQQPLASRAHRSIAMLLVLLMPLMCWAFWQRARFLRLHAERRHDDAVEGDACLSFVSAQEQALDWGLANYLDNAGGRRALYQLPWYLVLGEENAGKTSFITRSDQSFSLTRISKAQAQNRREEVAYPVDWWISNHAVIIDPPGEFVTQKSGAPDRQRLDGKTRPVLPPGTEARLWEHLLGWLARNRSRRALNGLVLVVDIVSLLQSTPQERVALAHLLRTRLHEVSTHLGSRLPLYVVLSKFDLLDGFDQLFASVAVSDREDVLGFTFKLDAVCSFDAWLQELGCHYDRLLDASQELMLDTLCRLSSVEERQRLLSLQAQLIGLRPALMNFLRETLASDRFTTPALVRGLYLTSVLQKGQTNNAFLRAAAQPYNMMAPVSDGKPRGQELVYFAQQVFQRIVYPEAGLAGDNVKVARDKRKLRWASSALGLLVGAVALGGWYRYFDVNRSKAVSVLAQSQAFSEREVDEGLDPTGRNLLAPLNQIRDAVSVFGDYRSAWPGITDAGLYQGRSIGPTVDETYLGLLSRRFLPSLASGLVDTMNAAPDGSDQQMAALRVYRMIEDRRNRRADWVEEWMAHRWQSEYPGQGQVQRDLMRHLKYALAYADVDLPQFRHRVAEVQETLRKTPLHERVYSSLKQQAEQQLRGGIDLRRQVGPAFDVVYRAVSDDTDASARLSLAALLTAKGFKEYFEPRSQQITDMALVDLWVLGERRDLDYSDADRDALTEKIRNIYSADYIDNWRRALNYFVVTDFRDLSHSVSVLEHLTGPAAPLRRLLEAVRVNTVIYPELSAPAKEVMDGASDTDLSLGPQHASGIRRAFAPLSQMLEEKGEKPSYYDETLGAITAVYDHAKAVQDSPDRGKSALNVVLQRFSMSGPDPIATLQRVATGLPEPVRQQVKTLADQTAQVLLIEALRELERRWDADVYSFFQQRLAHRYPFVVHAPDASLDDFEAFFGPKGRLQQFQDQYLKIFLKDNLDALYSERRNEYLVRNEVIEQLEAADRIRETFFDHRGSLSVQFSIEPLGLSTNQRTSLLDLDGQLISYTHGPSLITGVIWPNTLNHQVRSNLTLLKLNGNSSSLEYRGPWSMFRLLSRGSLNGRTPTSVDLSFRTGDGMMRYQLSSEKAFNPITQQPFKDFKLPRTLLRQAAPELAETGINQSSAM